MAHTPGEWEYLSEVTYAGDYPYSKAHRVKIGDRTITVSCHGYGWEGEGEEEANARMLAASSKMYEALKKVCQECKETAADQLWPTVTICSDCYVGIALRKAEGK